MNLTPSNHNRNRNRNHLLVPLPTQSSCSNLKGGLVISPPTAICKMNRRPYHDSFPQIKRMTSHSCIISRATTAFSLLSLLLSTAFLGSLADSSSVNCSRKCIAELCDTMGIKYGKYCGVGYSGCPGEKPCDDIDACCMTHDDCVGKFGMTHVKCHKKFKKCLIRAQKAGKVGFSKECPVSTAVPTMIRGMDLAIMLSDMGDNFHEL